MKTILADYKRIATAENKGIPKEGDNDTKQKQVSAAKPCNPTDSHGNGSQSTAC
jgi:hypothetical protein